MLKSTQLLQDYSLIGKGVQVSGDTYKVKFGTVADLLHLSVYQLSASLGISGSNKSPKLNLMLNKSGYPESERFSFLTHGIPDDAFGVILNYYANYAVLPEDKKSWATSLNLTFNTEGVRPILSRLANNSKESVASPSTTHTEYYALGEVIQSHRELKETTKQLNETLGILTPLAQEYLALRRDSTQKAPGLVNLIDGFNECRNIQVTVFFTAPEWLDAKKIEISQADRCKFYQTAAVLYRTLCDRNPDKEKQAYLYSNKEEYILQRSLDLVLKMSDDVANSKEEEPRYTILELVNLLGYKVTSQDTTIVGRIGCEVKKAIKNKLLPAGVKVNITQRRKYLAKVELLEFIENWFKTHGWYSNAA